MKNVIRLGDATSHGGKVIDVSARHFKVDHIAVARVGDLCSCPIKGHNGCTIATASAHCINGVSVAYDGDLTSCGAELQSSLATRPLKGEGILRRCQRLPRRRPRRRAPGRPVQLSDSRAWLTKVVEGDADDIVENKPVAFAGHQAACGAQRILIVGQALRTASGEERTKNRIVIIARCTGSMARNLAV